MGDLILKALCCKYLNTSSCKEQEIKAEILNSRVPFISTPNVFCTIYLEGTVVTCVHKQSSCIVLRLFVCCRVKVSFFVGVCQELQMDQQAKKHLQEEFDAALEEKDQMITVLQTQVRDY